MSRATQKVSASDVLTFDKDSIDPALSSGLWFCKNVVDISEVFTNAACLGSDCQLSDLADIAGFLREFPFILVIDANEAERMATAKAILRYVPGVEVDVSPQEAYMGCSSVTELRENHGYSAIMGLFSARYEVPPDGLLVSSAVERVDMATRPHISTGIKELDHIIGGLYGGEVSVWTGKTKAGKSSMIGQLILSAVRQGQSVCVYSGELTASQYMDWLLAMAAGPDNVYPYELDTGKTVYLPNPLAEDRIQEWLDGHLFLIDNSVENAHDPNHILALGRFAHRALGCSVLIVDNLMTVELDGEDHYRAQSKFVGSLVDFAHETGASVHLVAHRRKGAAGTGKKSKADNDEISGSSEIANRADNVFCISRIEDEESPFDSKLEVLANRDFGGSGEIPMHFEPKSRRFYVHNANWRCGWEEPVGVQTTFEDITDEDDGTNPFLQEAL